MEIKDPNFAIFKISLDKFNTLLSSSKSLSIKGLGRDFFLLHKHLFYFDVKYSLYF